MTTSCLLPPATACPVCAAACYCHLRYACHSCATAYPGASCSHVPACRSCATACLPLLCHCLPAAPAPLTARVPPVPACLLQAYLESLEAEPARVQAARAENQAQLKEKSAAMWSQFLQEQVRAGLCRAVTCRAAPCYVSCRAVPCYVSCCAVPRCAPCHAVPLCVMPYVTALCVMLCGTALCSVSVPPCPAFFGGPILCDSYSCLAHPL